VILTNPCCPCLASCACSAAAKLPERLLSTLQLGAESLVRQTDRGTVTTAPLSHGHYTGPAAGLRHALRACSPILPHSPHRLPASPLSCSCSPRCRALGALWVVRGQFHCERDRSIADVPSSGMRSGERRGHGGSACYVHPEGLRGVSFEFAELHLR
jgi:hypothetical protein